MRWRSLVLLTIAAIALAIVSWHPTQAPAIAQHVARVVVLGDSVAHGAGDETGRGISGDLNEFSGVVAENLGINGARTYDVARLLRTPGTRATIRSADAVILSIGGNDLFGDRLARLESLVWPSLAMRRTIAHIDHLVHTVQRVNPSARIYLVGLYNPYRNSSLTAFLDQQVAAWDSGLIAHFANQPGVDVIRIADLFAYVPRLSSIDHFHPGQSGYALIAERIAMTW
jgi:lysophospholipase L1-like esterase